MSDFFQYICLSQIFNKQIHMKKNLLYLFLLIGLSVSAKHLTVSSFNIETKSKKENSTTAVNTCNLNVTIGSTLDIPTSTFFVNEAALNGTAPYTYFLDGVLSPNGYTFYASTLNSGTHSVTVLDANGCTGSGIFEVIDVFPKISVITINPNCLEAGSITLSATGVFLPLMYSIDGGISFSYSGIFNNLKAGTYVSQVKDAKGNISSTTTVLTQPDPITANITHTDINCHGNTTGRISIIAKGGTAPYMFSIDNGITFQSNPEFNNLLAGTYHVIVKGSNSCMYTETIIITEPVAISATLTIENQNITVNAAGGTGIIHYSISPHLDQFVTSNIFTNLAFGSYEIIAQDDNGCYVFLNTSVNPSAPLLNGQKILDIKFTLGQTLGNIIIEGQNIKWYSSNGNTNSKLKTPEPTLPLNTVLADNTTYYASQTINGYESKERLAVTTKLSLSTADFVLPNFKLYPNPVKNIVTISNTSAIDELTFVSVKGDVILTKQINSLNSEIDLSNFSKGIYFLKIKSEGTEKTVKIIKE